MKVSKYLNGSLEGRRTYAGLTGDYHRIVHHWGGAGGPNELLGFLVLGSDKDLFASETPAFAQALGVEHYIAVGGYYVRDERVIDGVGASLNHLRSLQGIRVLVPDRRPESPPGLLVGVFEMRI